METMYAFAPYCKYALLSEDFESGLGWSYTTKSLYSAWKDYAYKWKSI